MVRQTGQSANPDLLVEALVENLLDLEAQRLRCGILTAEPTASQPSIRRQPRIPQGQILRTVKTVLHAQPQGLSITEIHVLVQDYLDRTVALHTVRAALAGHTGHHFERVRRGHYKLL